MDMKDLRSENINEIAGALAKAQGVMSNAATDKQNPHYKSKYATLDSVINAAKDALAANGLSVIQPVMPLSPGAMLVTMIMHNSGQWLASHYPLTLAGTPQQQGAAMTYMRRYNLMAMLGIAPSEAPEFDDDDGEEATKAHEASGRPAPQPEQPNHIEPPQEVEPPIDPKTGVTSPHRIEAPNTRVFAQKFIAALSDTADEIEIDEWIATNLDKLEFVQINANLMYKNLEVAIARRRKYHQDQDQ
jgi:ERF superfamily